MPQQSRSNRRKDALLLGGYTAVLFVVTSPVVSMMDAAWTANALSFNLIHALTRTFGVDIDLAVVFPVGLCIGWIVLFLLDQSKRIQAVILAVTGGGFVFLLIRSGRWTTTVDWAQHTGVLLIGVLLGILTGVAGAFTDRSVREFPTAAAGLYAVAASVTMVSFIEVHLSYRSPILAYPNVAAPSLQPGLVVNDGLLVNGISAALFVVVLATFVQYDDRKDVVLLTPTAVSETAVLAGLYDTIRNHRDRYTVDDDVARALSDAVGAIRAGADPAPLADGASIRVKRPGSLARWVEIETDGTLASHLGAPPFERLRNRQRHTALEYARRTVGRAVTAAFPFDLRRFAPEQRRLVERVDAADVVVLVVRTRDAVGADPTYVKAYRELDDIYESDRTTRVVIGALDPEAAFDGFEADRGVEPGLEKSSFRDYLRRSVLEVRSPVVPLSSEAEDETLAGSDELLSRIER